MSGFFGALEDRSARLCLGGMWCPAVKIYNQQDSSCANVLLGLSWGEAAIQSARLESRSVHSIIYIRRVSHLVILTYVLTWRFPSHQFSGLVSRGPSSLQLCWFFSPEVSTKVSTWVCNFKCICCAAVSYRRILTRHRWSLGQKSIGHGICHRAYLSVTWTCPLSSTTTIESLCYFRNR